MSLDYTPVHEIMPLTEKHGRYQFVFGPNSNLPLRYILGGEQHLNIGPIKETVAYIQKELFLVNPSENGNLIA